MIVPRSQEGDGNCCRVLDKKFISSIEKKVDMCNMMDDKGQKLNPIC